MESLWQSLCSILANTSAERLQLGTVELLFCAAFRSTHRDIVRFAAETWNRIYEQADHIEYPETLKNVLVSLGSSVDVTRPGLDIMDDSSNMRPNFTESQDNDNHLPLISPARFHPTPLSRPSASAHSATSGSAQTAETRSEGSTPFTRKRARGPTPKAKLRHEDSQIHFAAIESGPNLAAQESQLLTDRQKEIRDRQRETAAMFPAVCSSPTEKTKKARSTNKQQPNTSVDAHRASTPEHDGGFDDCLTSTPTPRRGQPVSLPEQDREMTDPPSSPPELRSFRLFAEIKSQINNTNPMDDWHFSSSPVSGSPNLINQNNSGSQSMNLDDVDEELQLDNENLVAQTHGILPPGQQDTITPQVEVTEDTTMYEQLDETDLSAATDHNANKHSHTTPSGRKTRARAAEITPRSDNDEFVDARSSPMPPTPSQRVLSGDASVTNRRKSPRHTANSQSFDVSASFENGLRNVGTGRIEIPLRSSQSTSPRKREYASYKDVLPESPEQQEMQASQPASRHEDMIEVMDVIEVAGDDIKQSRRARPRRPGSSLAFHNCEAPQSLSLNMQPLHGSQAQIPTTPVEELAAIESQGTFDNVSPGSGRWWRKRKRSVSSSIYSSGGSKKARHEDILAVENMQEEVPDSQAAAGVSAVQGGNVSSLRVSVPNIDALVTHSQDEFVEVQTMEELFQNDVLFTSNNNSSLIEHTTASQELPFAADEVLVGDLQPEPEVNVLEARTMYVEATDNDTDDEEAVHSQLAREEEESASRAASPARHIFDPAAHVQETVQYENEGEAALPALPALQQDAPDGQDAQQLADGPKPANDFDGLMHMFRNGLEVLRSADLSREQVYEVEDLMFDMRRELLQAEKRGRE